MIWERKRHARKSVALVQGSPFLCHKWTTSKLTSIVSLEAKLHKSRKVFNKPSLALLIPYIASGAN